MNTVARPTVVIPAQSSCSSGLHLLAYTGERKVDCLVGRESYVHFWEGAQINGRSYSASASIAHFSDHSTSSMAKLLFIGASRFSWRREAQCNPTASAQTSESSQEPLRCSKHI